MKHKQRYSNSMSWETPVNYNEKRDVKIILYCILLYRMLKDYVIKLIAQCWSLKL